MTILACTPGQKPLRRAGPQNIGYGTLFNLMIVNRANQFPSHRLWLKEGSEWRHIGSFNREGWTCDLSPELARLVDEEIDRVSLTDYLAWMASSGGNLTTDLDHWASIGITTARGLADYLDACVAHEFERD